MSLEQVIRLHEQEKVVGVIRQFGVVYLPSGVGALVVFAAPFFFMLPLFDLGGYGLVLFVLFLVAGTFWGVRTIFRWFWTVLVVTNQRIVDIDQKGLFDRVVSEASFDKIQDVSYARRGVWATLFNYGTLVIQTAGSTAHLEQYYVRRPQDVQHQIVKAMSGHAAGPTSERTQKVSALLEAASALSNVEARAFLHEVKGAIDEPRDTSEMVHSTDDEVEELMEDDELAGEIREPNANPLRIKE
jgi:uncharacterized membrane protein YdbT with pleckstrin-like domain